MQKLRQQQVPIQQVSDLSGVSPCSISRIEKEAPVSAIDDAAFQGISVRVGRPSGVTQYEAEIRQWLEEPRNQEDGPPKRPRDLSSAAGARI